MNSFQLIDASVVVVYLVASFIIGMKASKWMKSSDKTEEDYFLAGRKIPGWLAGVSVGVTTMNADVAPAYAGVAVAVGLPVSWFYISRFGLGLLIASLLFAFKWRRMGVNTGPEFFALRFGGKGGNFVRVWSSLWGVSVGMIPWIGAGILGVHTIVGPIFGYDDKATTLIVLVPILLAYVWKSGYSGVLLTDVLQTGFIVVANIAITFVVLWHYGGPAGLAEAIRHSLPKEAPEILSAWPVPGHEVLGPLLVFAWFILPTIGVGGNMQTEGQRVFSCINARESMKSFIWSEAVLFIMLLTLTLPVLGLLPNHPELYHASPHERERAYGLMLNEFFPVGVLGLALAAMTAAVTSSISGHLNFAAQTIVNDVVRVFSPNIAERRAILLGRLSMIVIMLASLVVVYSSHSLIGIAVSLIGLFAASASISWGQWWWWRTNFAAWVCSMVGGPIIYVALGAALPYAPGWAEYAAKGETAQQALSLLQAVIGLVVSLVAWILVAFCTAPEDMETLKKFYKRAQPMGLWGPVRKAIARDAAAAGEPVPMPQRPMLVKGMLFSLLGTAWIAAAMLALSKMYVGAWGESTVYGMAAAFMAIVFAKAFDNYHGLLEQDAADFEEGTVREKAA